MSDDYKFERVDNFKNLGVDINKDANSHNEINIRSAVANRFFFGLVPLFKLIKEFIMEIKKTTLQCSSETSSFVCICRAWATTKSDKLKLAIFERKILRNIYGPKKNNE